MSRKFYRIIAESQILEQDALVAVAIQRSRCEDICVPCSNWFAIAFIEQCVTPP